MYLMIPRQASVSFTFPSFETLRCATLLRMRVVRGASVFWLMVE